jgi:predicted RNA-binding protein with PIN domain
LKHLFLIDGYNLLHQIPELSADLSQELMDQRDKLIHTLVVFSARSNTLFQVVFDAPQNCAFPRKYPGVKVNYASPSADSLIRRIISNNQNNPRLTVVSSDRKHIGHFAKMSGVKWLTSKQFWRELTKSRSVKRTSGSSHIEEVKPPPGWSSEDDDWLRRVFSDDNGKQHE